MNPLRIAKKEFTCYDGPWAGHILFLSTAPTAYFKSNDVVGRYELDRVNKSYLVWKVQPNAKS
jgi:hypothetical protein